MVLSDCKVSPGWAAMVVLAPAATDALKALELAMRATVAFAAIFPSTAIRPDVMYLDPTVKKPKQFLLGKAAQLTSKISSAAPPQAITGPVYACCTAFMQSLTAEDP
eukprot:CAMPEP_0172681186 /NCGR_PEP_ID=MMETSP1074-20121228/17278_1 /TAXON_ID=2916 /ORGANISM="Ceratium fusus, Strain PA161109" /LENGTH=106 /DNA_ID=CAMNT_0013499645 /DNA_START=111 /DNA_END=431 /DNA_ORIENTATION=-